METYKVLFKEGETTGVYGISLVNDPAMESLWVALSKEEQVQLKSINNEKRIVCGAVLIPNKPIYRNQDGAEFNIVFPAETIRLASEGFLKGGFQKSSTLEHNVDAKIDGVSIVESWIVEDEKQDKSVLYDFRVPKGTWMASMKIDNSEIWNDYVKTGKVKGFSIDGFFDMEKVNLKSELNMSEQKSFIDEVKQIIKEGFASLSLKKETEVKLGSVNTADGSVKINFEGDTIVTGLAVTMTSPDGSELALPDGEYSLEGGMNITVMGGLVEEVSTAKEEATDTETPMNPQTPMSTDTPQVKSEKVTQEVFYQLSKEDMASFIVEVGNMIDAKVDALKVELTKEEKVVELTKAKPAKESTQPINAFEKFRQHNNKFKNK